LQRPNDIKTSFEKKKKLAKAHKNEKRSKHVPCVDVRLQRRMFNLAASTNPNGGYEPQRRRW